MKENHIGTKCIHEGYKPGNGEPRQVPVYQSTTFKYETSDEMGQLFDLEKEGYFYTRLQNPTNDVVAAKIAALEGGVAAMLTSSGQAANFMAVFNICEAGDHFISSSSIYGGTFNLFTVTMKKMGIECTVIDQDMPEEEIDKLFKPNTKAVFGETITNPTVNIFDIEKLKWMNETYLRKLSLQDFHQLVFPYYQHITQDIDFLELSLVLQPRLEKLKDIETMTDFINKPYPFDVSLYTHKKMKTTPETSLKVLQLIEKHLKDFDNFTNDDLLVQLFISLAKDNGLKNGQIMWPIRVALTNKSLTPGGAVEIIHILGQDESLKRIHQAIIDLTLYIQRKKEIE